MIAIKAPEFIDKRSESFYNKAIVSERTFFMKYALIGCGRIAGNHIRAAKDNGLEIAALCDIVPEKAAALAEREGLGGVPIYSDYKKLLTELRPELVSIAAISGAHAMIAVDCAKAGVNFIVEKPMAMSIAEADSVIAAVEKSGVKAAVCHQNRFNIAVQQLKRAVDEGRFGVLSHGSVQIRWHRGEGYYSQDDWRGKWATDGGTLMNQCIHGIDLLRWIFGDEVRRVYGATRRRLHPYIEGEDIGTAVVEFSSGAVATIEGTTNAFEDLEETLCVFGEKGMVRLGGMAANTIDVWRFSDERPQDSSLTEFAEESQNVYGNGHTSLFLDMIRAITDDRTPYVDVYAGKRALELVLAVYQSQKTGEPVDFPLNDFSSAEMTGEFD